MSSSAAGSTWRAWPPGGASSWRCRTSAAGSGAAPGWPPVGYPMTSVAERLEPPELYDWFVEQRQAMGLTIVPLGQRLRAGRCSRRCAQGRLVGLLCDRDIVGNGIEVEFFGETTTFPAGPATLALRTGAALLAAAVYSGPGRDHTARHHPPRSTPTGPAACGRRRPGHRRRSPTTSSGSSGGRPSSGTSSSPTGRATGRRTEPCPPGWRSRCPTRPPTPAAAASRRPAGERSRCEWRWSARTAWRGPAACRGRWSGWPGAARRSATTVVVRGPGDDDRPAGSVRPDAPLRRAHGRAVRPTARSPRWRSRRAARRRGPAASSGTTAPRRRPSPRAAGPGGRLRLPAARLGARGRHVPPVRRQSGLPGRSARWPAGPTGDWPPAAPSPRRPATPAAAAIGRTTRSSSTASRSSGSPARRRGRPTGPTVLFLGRHEPRKGLGVPPRRLCRSCPTRRVLWVAGDGPGHRCAPASPPASRAASSGWVGWTTTRWPPGWPAPTCCAPRRSVASRSAWCCSRGWPPGAPWWPRDIPGYRAAAGGHAVLVPPGDPWPSGRPSLVC